VILGFRADACMHRVGEASVRLSKKRTKVAYIVHARAHEGRTAPAR
jgi:hypothetical protein